MIEKLSIASLKREQNRSKIGVMGNPLTPPQIKIESGLNLARNSHNVPLEWLYLSYSTKETGIFIMWAPIINK